MTTVSTNKVLMVAAGVLLALGSLAGCSGSGSDGGNGGDGNPSGSSVVEDSVEPAPVGGINGPARFDPDAVGVNDGEPQD